PVAQPSMAGLERAQGKPVGRPQIEGPSGALSGILTASGPRSEGARGEGRARPAPPSSFPPVALPACRPRGKPSMDLARNLKVESVSRLQPTPPLQLRPS